MNYREMGVKLLAVGALLGMTACATIVNDANVPVALSFSDGSEGTCTLTNSRAAYTVELPATQMVRRARSPLTYNCETSSGKKVTGTIPSSMEGGKVAASVIFWDFGITDSITEKARTYPASYVIPVK